MPRTNVRDAFNVSKTILGFDIAPILFEGTANDLKQDARDPTGHLPALHRCLVDHGRGCTRSGGRSLPG